MAPKKKCDVFIHIAYVLKNHAKKCEKNVFESYDLKPCVLFCKVCFWINPYVILPTHPHYPLYYRRVYTPFKTSYQ